MTDLRQTQALAPPSAADMALDQGLRGYMLGVYNKVALGLLLTAAMAYLTSSVPPVRDLLFRTVTAEGAPRLTGMTFLGSLVTIAPFFAILASGLALRRPTAFSTAALYWSIVTLVGASLGVLVLTFTGTSIAIAFAVSAAAFGALSLTGYVTRRDLGGLRSFLVVGLAGLVLALVVNLFLRSAGVQYVASLAGVLIFAGLIAYDTQRLKLAYYGLGGDAADRAMATNYGALSLYVNFVNLFQFLLMLLSGDRR